MVHIDAVAKNAGKKRGRKNSIVATVCILLFLLQIAWNSAKYGDIVKVTQEAMAETGSVAVQHVQEDTDKFSLASSQSYGFFDDVTDKHWKILQKIAVEHVNHKVPDKPLTHNPVVDKRKVKYNSSYPAWWQTVSPTRELACSTTSVTLGQEEAPNHLMSTRIMYYVSLLCTYVSPALLIIVNHHSCCCPSTILHAICIEL